MQDLDTLSITRSVRAWCVAASLTALALPAAADDVHLRNGQTFSDVIAIESERGVTIREAFGEITLPASAVERIVRSESNVDRYLARKRELVRRGAEAAEWLSLAEWAYAEEVTHGAREAALAAAKREPQLEGLGPLLRTLGYVYSDARQAWLAHDDYMRSIGYVRVGGEWVSPEAIAERKRLAEEAAAARREQRAAARDERLAEAVELLTLAELADRAEPTPPQPTAGLPIAVFPGYYTPTRFVAPRRSVSPPYAATPSKWDPAYYENSPHAIDILVRQPGSLFPIRSHRGSLNTIRR